MADTTMVTLLSFNWEFQALARRMAADLRRLGVDVRHSLDGSSPAQPRQPYGTIIALLSKSYEDSPAARHEILSSMGEQTKMIAVIMEHQYEPGDWVAVACQGCPRLYLLNDEQYPACLMRIRFELPQTSAQDRFASMPAFEALSLSSHEMWEEVESNFVVPGQAENTEFLYVNVRCRLDEQQIAFVDDSIENIEDTILTRVFNTFCIFDDEIDISMCRLFEGPDDSTFMCLRGDTAMVDTVISEGAHFFANDHTLDNKLGGLLRYQEFRDLIFCTRRPRLAPQTALDDCKFQVVLCSVQGRAIKSPPFPVAQDESASVLLEHIHRWLKIGESAREPTMLTWNPEGGMFRKLVGTLANYWTCAEEVAPKLMSIEVLVESFEDRENEETPTAFAIKPSDTSMSTMWFRLSSLQDYVNFTVSTVCPSMTDGIVIEGSDPDLQKLRSAHENGTLAELLQVPLELVDIGAVPRPPSAEVSAIPLSDDTLTVTQIDESEEISRPTNRSEVTALEMSQRLRRNIRAIEGNLGYIRPTVNRNATFSEASTDLRRNFILFGVNGVKETLTTKMRIEPVFVEHHSLLRDRGRSGNSSGSGSRQRSSYLQTSGSHGNLTGDDVIAPRTEDEPYKVQLNRLVKMLKSSRTYQNSVQCPEAAVTPAAGDAAAPPPPGNSPAGSPRLNRVPFSCPSMAPEVHKPSGRTGITLPPTPVFAPPPSHPTSSNASPAVSRRNSDDAPNDGGRDIPTTWHTVEFQAHVRHLTEEKFSKLDAQRTGRVAMRAVREHMQSDAGFAEEEVSALLAEVKVGIGGSGLLTYAEFHELCLHALLGAQARALLLRDSYSLYEDTDV